MADLLAWCQLMAVPMRPWEAQALAQIDRLWVHAWHAGRPRTQAVPDLD